MQSPVEFSRIAPRNEIWMLEMLEILVQLLNCLPEWAFALHLALIR